MSPKRNETGNEASLTWTITLSAASVWPATAEPVPLENSYFLREQWNRHKSPYRKLRHMAKLPRSASFQRLVFPDLFCISTVAGCWTYYNEFISVATGIGGISMPAFAGATTAIGLLAGFRLNASYERYTEGRQLWSDVNSATRNLARLAKMWLHNNHPDSRATRLLRLCQAFPIALLFHLNDKGNYHNMKRKSKPGEASFEERVQAEFEAELYDVYRNDPNDNQTAVLLEDFYRFCKIKSQGGNVPLEVVNCMSESIAAAVQHDNLHPFFAGDLDEQVQILTLALGGCERMVKTPLPTGFTRHSSRLLFLWANCLPFALYPLAGPVGTLPTSLLTAYAVLGIEDISVQLEEPFDILPLRQYSDSMYEGIQAIEQNYKDTK